jgi:hypothetical protein
MIYSAPPVCQSHSYRNTVRPVDPPEDNQLDLDLFPEAKTPESQQTEPITQLRA